MTTAQRQRLLGNRDWLAGRYEGEQLTLAEIAGELGCSTSTVRNALERHGIPRRARGPVAGGSTVVHGHNRRGRRTATYRSWAAMVTRCTNPNSAGWRYYGGCGISVCAEWVGPGGFEAFLADMGERPAGKTLDRLDPYGDYTPTNCTWATRAEQDTGRRSRRPDELELLANGGWS